MRRALVTGVTGQDGSYLAELLLGKGYEVWGLVRRSSGAGAARLAHLAPDQRARLRLVEGDMTDPSSLRKAVREARPDEVYNLAAQSHVRVSFDLPEHTAAVTGLGALHLLEALREGGHRPRYYQASSSEQFGRAREAPQRESTPFAPCSPYAVAKVFAHETTVSYREAYGLHASTGILFNHESPRRGEAFVTRKITRAAARIRRGLQRELLLGDLDARRDWGFAGDYVDAMWRMLQQDAPGDYVVATGVTHSVRDVLDRAFGRVGLDWSHHVQLDPRFRRPVEVAALVGDATKARAALGWAPTVDFAGLIDMMVDHDLALADAEARGGTPPPPAPEPA